MICRTKFLSDDWMEDNGFLEKERNEDHSKFWYVNLLTPYPLPCVVKGQTWSGLIYRGLYLPSCCGEGQILTCYHCGGRMDAVGRLRVMSFILSIDREISVQTSAGMRIDPWPRFLYSLISQYCIFLAIADHWHPLQQ